MQGLINYTPILLLPAPNKLQSLRSERQRYLDLYITVKEDLKQLRDITLQVIEIGKGIKVKYERTDRELAELDGRLKKAEKAKRKAKTISEAAFTSEQIAMIAQALNIELEVT